MNLIAKRVLRGACLLLALWGAAQAGGNSALDVLDTRPRSGVVSVEKSSVANTQQDPFSILPSSKVKNKKPYISEPGYRVLPGYHPKSRSHYIVAHNIRLSEALAALGEKDHVTYFIVGSDIALPDSKYKIKSFRDLRLYLKKTTPYIIEREKGKFRKGDLVRVLVYRRGFLAKKKLSLFGESSLYRALGILGSEKINIIFQNGLPNKKIHLGISTKNLDKYVMSVCEAADVWCDFTRQNLNVAEKKQFVVSSPVGGGVTFTSTGNSGGGSGKNGGGSSLTRTFKYEIKGLDYEGVTKLMAQNFPDVTFSYSASGFYTFMATPSQYRRIMKFFAEEKSRKEVIYADIQLIRVDLDDSFKWGIDWTKVAAFALGNHSFGAGMVANNFLPTEDGGWIGLIDKGRSKIVDTLVQDGIANGTLDASTYDSLMKSKYGGIAQIFSKFGDVHEVNSWFNQMVTGVPLPFSDYQLVRYFTVGSTSNGDSTETTVEVRQDEVGFKGVITVNKSNDGYLVEGYVDQSFVKNFIELQTTNGILRAPNIVGKSVRIQTRLSDLGSTIIVGGFRGKGLTKKEGGVPVLKDIPILGLLFKNKEDATKNSEFVILITLRKAKEGNLE